MREGELVAANPSGSFPLSFTMGEWALVIGALRSRTAELRRGTASDASDDEVAEAYGDLESLEAVLKHVCSEFERRYGGLPG